MSDENGTTTHEQEPVTELDLIEPPKLGQLMLPSEPFAWMVRPKRPGGRPRKHPFDPNPPPKRPRGRPRKVVDANAPQVQQVQQIQQIQHEKPELSTQAPVEVITPQEQRKWPAKRPVDLNLIATKAARRELDRKAAEAANDIFDLLLEGAKKGDGASLKILCDRLWPVRKGSVITFTVPPINTPQEVDAAYAHFLEEAAKGVMTLEEASTICGLLEKKARAIENTILAQEIENLRQKVEAQTMRGELLM